MKWEKIPDLEHASEAGAYREGHWSLWFGPRNRHNYNVTFKRSLGWMTLWRTAVFYGEPDLPTYYIKRMPDMTLDKKHMVACVLANTVAESDEE